MKLKESITAFFPAYNDEATIGKIIQETNSILKEIADDYEIIVVDDGSKDRTKELCNELAEKNPRIRVIHHEHNRGYGGALKSGFANARKDLIFYTDGDGQYDVKELKKLAPFIQDADVVNGYKMKRQDPIYRKVLGRIYFWAAKILFKIRLKDIDCDFRLMRRSIFDNIELGSNSGVICVEMMKKIQDAGYRIKEVEIHHYPRVSGRSQFFRINHILRLFKELTRQWWRLVILKIGK